MCLCDVRIREAVFQQVCQGVKELHSIGFAHCDICVENVFVDDDNTIFLGDLEYCRRCGAPPPTHTARADSSAKSAEELDLIQLKVLEDELPKI